MKWNKQHLKTHTIALHNKKDHKREACGKSFTDAGKLKRHIHAVHEGHKDHKCVSCSKSFSQAGTLKTHSLTFHEGHKDE